MKKNFRNVWEKNVIFSDNKVVNSQENNSQIYEKKIIFFEIKVVNLRENIQFFYEQLHRVRAIISINITLLTYVSVKNLQNTQTSAESLTRSRSCSWSWSRCSDGSSSVCRETSKNMWNHQRRSAQEPSL